MIKNVKSTLNEFLILILAEKITTLISAKICVKFPDMNFLNELIIILIHSIE